MSFRFFIDILKDNASKEIVGFENSPLRRRRLLIKNKLFRKMVSSAEGGEGRDPLRGFCDP